MAGQKARRCARDARSPWRRDQRREDQHIGQLVETARQYKQTGPDTLHPQCRVGGVKGRVNFCGTPKKQATPVVLQLVRLSDNKVIATNGAGEAVRLTPEWNLFKLSFNPVLPNGEPGSSGEYHSSEVLSRDGAYAVRLRLDGKPYGEYAFTVNGGQIQFQGRQLHDPAKPLELIEDVPNTWWLKRKIAP